MIELRTTTAQISSKCFKVTVKPHSNEAGKKFGFLQHNFPVELVHILREIAENLRSYYLLFLRFLRPFKKSANRKNLKNRKNRKMLCDWMP